MSQSERRQNPNIRQRRKLGRLFVPLVSAAATLLILFALVIAAVVPKRYEYKLGDKAGETITATRDTEDTVTTEALRRAAENGVEIIYSVDNVIVKNATSKAEAFFDELDALREKARTTVIDASNGSVSAETLDGKTPEEWRLLLDEEALDELRVPLEVYLEDELMYAVIAADESDMARLSDAVLPRLTTALSNGLGEDALSTTMAAITKEITATSLSADLKSVAKKAAEKFLTATLVEDAAKTNVKREEAAAAVETLIVKKGETIVTVGDTLSQAQIQLMTDMELIRPASSDVSLEIGVALYIAITIACFWLYVYMTDRKRSGEAKNIIMTCILVIVSAALTVLFARVDSRFNPIIYAALMSAVLISRNSALAVNTTIALIAALIAGGRVDVFQSGAISALLITLVGGSAGVFMAQRADSRTKVMVAGVVAGGAAALTSVAIDIILVKGVGAVLIDAAWALGSDLVATVLCIGTMQVWESIFDVTTSARLNELSNTNHRLLKELMAEAPGTYHHSIMVAALAEAAAQEIGANAALARVGAYFHDVGKLRRPQCFKENQHGENPLEIMPACDAAATVLAHVRDGVTLCQKFKLPHTVTNIVAEHHGNTAVVYFYDKAVKESQGKPVNPKLFRYQAGRVSSKESAIVMLADSVEAAVRSLPEYTREAAAEMTARVIHGKLEDNQLTNAPITFEELTIIERSFLKTLQSLRHDRVEYPETTPPPAKEANNDI
jgi:putative nucleotidyltransferase with HDIG domain